MLARRRRVHRARTQSGPTRGHRGRGHLDTIPPMLANVLSVLLAFLKLGCISFGGPVAHLGYFHKEFVAKRGWLDEDRYASIVALCQFLPGPASSQVVFAIGLLRAGVLGAIAGSVAFMLPSVCVMILAAVGLAQVGDVSKVGWIHGLKLAAVVVVAQAVWSMGRRLCPDLARVVLALVAAGVVLIGHSALLQVAVIALGALAGWMIYGRTPIEPGASHKPESETRRAHPWAAASLVVFALLLVALPVVVHFSGSRGLDVVDGFYRSGSMVFGGGHVVLPLLREEVVPPGYITDDTFLAGYGVAQAIPGPLFTFAAYLGASIFPAHPVAGGLSCLAAIFLPAWLLVGGALPYWERLRHLAPARSAVMGVSAAVVGVLLSALIDPVLTEAMRTPLDGLAASVGLVMLMYLRLPVWVVVLVMAGVGEWEWGLG